MPFRASAIAAAAASAETSGGAACPAMSNARPRACGSAWSCIQPCSSHSRIAPASGSTEIAQPRSVRIAGLFAFVIHRDRSCGDESFPSTRSARLARGRDSKTGQARTFLPVPPTCAKRSGGGLIFLVGAVHDDLQRVVGHGPLQRFGLVLGGAHPDILRRHFLSATRHSRAAVVTSPGRSRSGCCSEQHQIARFDSHLRTLSRRGHTGGSDKDVSEQPDCHGFRSHRGLVVRQRRDRNIAGISDFYLPSEPPQGGRAAASTALSNRENCSAKI
jgi:hypothetical protein